MVGFKFNQNQILFSLRVRLRYSQHARTGSVPRTAFVLSPCLVMVKYTTAYVTVCFFGGVVGCGCCSQLVFGKKINFSITSNASGHQESAAAAAAAGDDVVL